MDRSIDPVGAADGAAMGVGDGEAAGDGDGEAVANGLELGGVPGAVGAWALDVGVLPHAAMDISATIAANRQTRLVTAICKG